MELVRRRLAGRPPVYLEPDTGFIAKIYLSGYNYDNMGYITYTYLIASNGRINFRARREYIKQPKMKWATLITKWLKTSIPRLRQIYRTDIFKEELIATVYSPERMMRLNKDIPDIDDGAE